MPHEHYSDRAHPEFVVLEIGDELGALVVHTGPEMHGTEIEISPAGKDMERSHKEVLERAAGRTPSYTAVFDQLPGGAYTLWTEGIPRIRGVEVAGGAVAELRWPTARAAV